VRSHCKSHGAGIRLTDVGRLRRVSTRNSSRSVGPQMLCRLPTTAVLRAPAWLSTAARCTSICSATWPAAAASSSLVT
jgi:hypothetical protein